MRQSRFSPSPRSTLRFTERDLMVMELFNDYRLLPFNWLHALVGGPYVGLRLRCTALVAHGFLGRFTFNGTRNIYETMTYFLTEKGRKDLIRMGYPAPDPYDKTHDSHQVLLDILDAGIELGSRTSTTGLMKWDYIKNHERARIEDSPFKFKLDKTWLIPDGRPFVLRNQNGAFVVLKELDRNTEAPSTIKQKIKNYHLAEKMIKERYGCNRLLLLWVTTNETRRQNILSWIGQSQWMLTHTIQDHTPLGHLHPVSTKHFDEPYLRAGYPPFSLKTLAEV